MDSLVPVIAVAGSMVLGMHRASRR
jgi:hypothetical protein